jgi:hypothetical protein
MNASKSLARTRRQRPTQRLVSSPVFSSCHTFRFEIFKVSATSLTVNSCSTTLFVLRRMKLTANCAAMPQCAQTRAPARHHCGQKSGNRVSAISLGETAGEPGHRTSCGSPPTAGGLRPDPGRARCSEAGRDHDRYGAVEVHGEPDSLRSSCPPCSALARTVGPR